MKASDVTKTTHGNGRGIYIHRLPPVHTGEAGTEVVISPGASYRNCERNRRLGSKVTIHPERIIQELPVDCCLACCGRNKRWGSRNAGGGSSKENIAAFRPASGALKAAPSRWMTFLLSFSLALKWIILSLKSRAVTSSMTTFLHSKSHIVPGT